MRLLLALFFSLTLCSCGALQPQASKSDALRLAAKRLKCSQKKLKHRVLLGGSGKFGVVRPKFYAVAGCKKRTCIKCKSKCTVYERKTKDKCPGGLAR